MCLKSVLLHMAYTISLVDRVFPDNGEKICLLAKTEKQTPTEEHHTQPNIIRIYNYFTTMKLEAIQGNHPHI